jgi:hypothetical protein
MKFFDNKMEDALQNGVKETKSARGKYFEEVHDVLENGVKETKQKNNALLILDTSGRELILESHLVVRDGVKETSHRQFLKTYDVKDTIQDGTEHDRWILDGCDDPVDEVLGNGVKSSIPRQYVGENIIDKVIDKGVIETHREICEYKHTVDYIIQTGVKETHEDVYHHKGRIDGVIKNGIKEIKVSDYNIPGEEFYITDQYLVDEVLENGVKKTMAAGYTDPKTSILHIKWGTQIEDVIDNGNKVCGTYVGGHRQEEKTETVIEYGTKNPTV